MSLVDSRAREATRLEIERRLVDGGLVRGPRRLRSGVRIADEFEKRTGPAFLQRLHEVLHELGPVFASFGAYLARRPDLLPIADCVSLAELVRGARWDARPAAGVRQHLSAALGRPLGEIFSTFDDEPRNSGPLEQCHRAVLADGLPVLVRVRSPGLGALAERDLDLLRLLAPAFSDYPDLRFDEAVTDFRLWFARRTDFTLQADQLQDLAHHAADFDLLAVPQVHLRLSSESVLTVDLLEGTELAALTADESEARRHDAARRLHLLLLEQALVAGIFPVAADLVRMEDGRLGILGGELVTIPAASKANLWRYLQATAVHRPDRVCDCLVRELEPAERGADQNRLLLRLRQAVPFRDGSWSEHGDTLAEFLILHWPVARRSGFRPRRHLEAFYQGLFWAAQLGRDLAPDADPLRDAREDMRWLAGWIEFRELTDPRQLGAALEENFASLLELPQKIDRILDLAASGEPGFRVQVRNPPPARRQNASTVAICLGLMMAILVLVSSQLGAVGLDARWVERLSAVFFLALGGGLLWAIVRRPGGRTPDDHADDS